MTRVAIHQPNYFPWYGYFRKISRCDKFIYLDDVQYSKGSFTNRVKISDVKSESRWMTIPISFDFKDNINIIRKADNFAFDSHCELIQRTYFMTPYFKTVFPVIEEIISDCGEENLLWKINKKIIEHLCDILKINCEFSKSSDYLTSGFKKDFLLIELISKVAPGGIYICGAGGEIYQNKEKFYSAGVRLEMCDSSSVSYPQTERHHFVPGLSILDMLFNVGISETMLKIKNA